MKFCGVPGNVNCQDLNDKYRERRKCNPQERVKKKRVQNGGGLGIRKCTAYRKGMG